MHCTINASLFIAKRNLPAAQGLLQKSIWYGLLLDSRGWTEDTREERERNFEESDNVVFAGWMLFMFSSVWCTCCSMKARPPVDGQEVRCLWWWDARRAREAWWYRGSVCILVVGLLLFGLSWWLRAERNQLDSDLYYSYYDSDTNTIQYVPASDRYREVRAPFRAYLIGTNIRAPFRAYLIGTDQIRSKWSTNFTKFRTGKLLLVLPGGCCSFFHACGAPAAA